MLQFGHRRCLVVMRVSMQFLQNAGCRVSRTPAKKGIKRTVHALGNYDLAHALLACTTLDDFLLFGNESCSANRWALQGDLPKVPRSPGSELPPVHSQEQQ